MKKSLQIVSENGSACSSAGAESGLITPMASGTVRPDTYLGKAAVITLGCSKNQIDSEVMLGALVNKGFEIVNDVEDADVAVVNTCGFLQAAVKESIDTILDVAEYKSAGRLRKLIVAGCMVERFREELVEELLEVDHFIGTDDLLHVGNIADEDSVLALQQSARPYFLYDDTMPRYLSTQGHTAYVKVAEGCDRPCTFCIIPRIRGAMRSREIESIVREVQDLREAGVREVNLVAQDLTAFGRDRREGNLSDLLERLDRETEIDWVRLLYAYPVGTDERLLQNILELDSVCEYLDMPLQHVSERVLRGMKRPIGRYGAQRIIPWIRNAYPGIFLRTTFIVGFPGETEEDVRQLEEFVREGHFTSVGVFEFSLEEGTPSATMRGQLSAEEKAERRERIMLAQQEAVEKKAGEFIGKCYPVIVEGTHEETDMLWTGRTRFQAPEVDGQVLVNDIIEEVASALEPGMLAEVEITDTAGYDLVGTLLPVARPAQPLADDYRRSS